MRTLRSIVVLVAVAGMLVGCGAGSTPQGTFDKMKSMGKTNDMGAMLKYLTPESQNLIVGGRAYGPAMMANMAKASGKGDPKIEAVLKKHGIDIGNLPKMSGKGDTSKAIKTLGAAIKDKPGFLADMEKLNPKKGKQSSMADQMANSTLKDVKITGNTAEGKIVVKKDGKETTQPIHFKLVGGEWLVDLIPVMSPAGK
jgi:hypothetical protein